MAYETKNFNLVAANVGAGQGGSVWTYVSATDNVVTVKGAAYVTDGADKGAKVGDVVLIAGTDAGIGVVDTVNANGSIEIT